MRAQEKARNAMAGEIEKHPDAWARRAKSSASQLREFSPKKRAEHVRRSDGSDHWLGSSFSGIGAHRNDGSVSKFELDLASYVLSMRFWAANYVSGGAAAHVTNSLSDSAIDGDNVARSKIAGPLHGASSGEKPDAMLLSEGNFHWGLLLPKSKNDHEDKVTSEAVSGDSLLASESPEKGGEKAAKQAIREGRLQLTRNKDGMIGLCAAVDDLSDEQKGSLGARKGKEFNTAKSKPVSLLKAGAKLQDGADAEIRAQAAAFALENDVVKSSSDRTRRVMEKNRPKAKKDSVEARAPPALDTIAPEAITRSPFERRESISIGEMIVVS